MAVVIVLAGLRMVRNRRIQQANLAFIHNTQAQQESYYATYPSNQPPNYAAPGPYYQPPPGPPPQSPYRGYDPTNAPQYPPATYATV